MSENEFVEKLVNAIDAHTDTRSDYVKVSMWVSEFWEEFEESDVINARDAIILEGAY